MTFIIAIMKLSTRHFFPQVAGTAPTGGTFSACTFAILTTDKHG